MENHQEHIVNYRGQKYHFMIDNPSDVIQRDHNRGRFYELEELEYLKSVIPPKSIVIDIGANIGNHSIYFGLVCRAEMVIPFEVNEEAIRLFNRNIERNNAGNIDLSFLGLALGKADGFVSKRPLKQVNNLGATSFVTSSVETEYRVKRLDDLLINIKPNFIKIDVEGMEFDVLSGAMETIINNRPILFIEVRESDTDRYFELMKSINYRTERTFQRYRGVYNFLSMYGR